MRWPLCVGLSFGFVSVSLPPSQLEEEQLWESLLFTGGQSPHPIFASELHSSLAPPIHKTNLHVLKLARVVLFCICLFHVVS